MRELLLTTDREDGGGEEGMYGANGGGGERGWFRITATCGMTGIYTEMFYIVGISDYSEFVNSNGTRIYLSPIY
jgi:hypothetical protein